jgi:hypothetical protein
MKGSVETRVAQPPGCELFPENIRRYTILDQTNPVQIDFPRASVIQNVLRKCSSPSNNALPFFTGIPSGDGLSTSLFLPPGFGLRDAAALMERIS